MAKPLAGKIALVTGATKGIGRGIAIQLGQNGAKVYFTGRTLKSSGGSGGGGSLEDTLEEIKKRGGQNAVPVQCDHEKASEVEELFKRIQKDEKGHLDILVNNVYKGVETIFASIRQKFWESPDPARIWDDINNAGLRNHFICTALASRLMVPRRQGLIVNVSSLGGQGYLFNVAYGVGKAGVDRMAVDCGIELKKHNVACLSLMLGAVRTEKMTNLVSGAAGDKLKLKGDPNAKQSQDTSLKKILDEGESVEFGGKIITHMAGDETMGKKIMKYSSKVVIAADYAHKYNITDVDGRVVPSHREFRNAAMALPKQYRWMANYVPGTLKVPNFLISIANNKVC